MNDSRQGLPAMARTVDEFVAAGQRLPETLELTAFVRDACRHSGLDPKSLNPQYARYSMVTPDGSLIDGLEFSSPLEVDGEILRLGDFIAAQLRHEQASLARAVWALDSFQALKDFLGAMRALVRYGEDPDGSLRAQVMPAWISLQLVEQIETGEGLISNGELAMDSVTRLLGLRRKLLLLDYASRQHPEGWHPGNPTGKTRSRPGRP